MLRCNCASRAFVLVELIMVVIILAIVGIMLFPLFARAFDQARNTPCLDNMHQIGMALRLYTHDYDFTFPIANEEAAERVGDTWGEGFSGHWRNWDRTRRDYHQKYSIGARLAPYACEFSAWVCPMDRGASKNWTIGERWSSYHYRLFLTSGFAPGFRDFGGMRDRIFRDADFQYPTQTYVFNEMWPWHDDRRSDLTWMPESDRSGWHRGARIRFVFMDGHTKMISVDRCLAHEPAWKGQGYDYHWPRAGDYIDCE